MMTGIAKGIKGVTNIRNRVEKAVLTRTKGWLAWKSQIKALRQIESDAAAQPTGGASWDSENPANELVREWVVPISWPVIWLFQPPRSGGTMFTRLFDSHPEMHVNPVPMGYSWPQEPNLGRIEDKFSLAKYNRVGFQKQASNRTQPIAPIYFDESWYRAILADARIDTPRNAVNAANTAFFNAWRNYQNLYGPKKYVLMHSTIWRRVPIEKRVPNFFAAFPDGYTIFIARCPEDWLASGAKLERSQLNDMELALDEYVAAYETYHQMRQQNQTDRMIVLEFNSLVRCPRTVLAQLCERLGIAYHATLETTTFNRMPVSANSAHEGEEKFAPDPSLIGKGVEIREAANRLPKFETANRLFESLRSIAIS